MHTISAEMVQMGEFILLAAQTAAAEQGVTALTEVRHGDVADEIINLCREINADFVVLGQSSPPDGNLLNPQFFEEFSRRVRQETQAVIVLSEKKA